MIQIDIDVLLIKCNHIQKGRINKTDSSHLTKIGFFSSWIFSLLSSSLLEYELKIWHEICLVHIFSPFFSSKEFCYHGIIMQPD